MFTCETNCAATASVIASENEQKLCGCYVTADVILKIFLAFELMDGSIVGRVC